MAASTWPAMTSANNVAAPSEGSSRITSRMKAPPNTPPDQAYHGRHAGHRFPGRNAFAKCDHRNDHGEEADRIADQCRPGRRTQCGAQIAVEHLLGCDTDAGAEREEIKEEMLHEGSR